MIEPADASGILVWDGEQRKFTSCGFNKILVTGPQRSGTRFLTDVLSSDLKLPAYFEPQDQLQFGDMTKGVWQGPRLSHKVHMLEMAGTLVVWLVRNTKEILASEARIKWRSAHTERNLLPPEYRDGVLCEQRYRYWQEVQKHSVRNWVEIRYESLEGHRLWASPQDRKRIGGFVPTRTRL